MTDPVDPGGEEVDPDNAAAGADTEETRQDAADYEKAQQDATQAAQDGKQEAFEAAKAKKIKAQNNVIKSAVSGMKLSGLSGAEVDKITTDIRDYVDANFNGRIDLTAEEMGQVRDHMIKQYGRKYGTYENIQKSFGSRMWNGIKNFFKSSNSEEAVEAQRQAKAIEAKNKTGDPVTDKDVKDFQAAVDAAVKKILSDDPEKTKEADSKLGGRLRTILAILLGLGGLAGLIYAGYALAAKYSGCYKFVTGVPGVKLQCGDFYKQNKGDNETKCSCGSAPRDGKVDETKCASSTIAEQPYCKCADSNFDTCSSNAAEEGGISYYYQDIGPFDALVNAIVNAGNDLFKPVADIGKYIKYFMYAIAGVVGLVIFMNILKAFGGGFGGGNKFATLRYT